MKRGFEGKGRRRGQLHVLSVEEKREGDGCSWEKVRGDAERGVYGAKGTSLETGKRKEPTTHDPSLLLPSLSLSLSSLSLPVPSSQVHTPLSHLLKENKKSV